MTNDSLPEFALRKPMKQLKPRRPIKRRTAKRSKEEAIYRKRVKEWLVGKFCAANFIKYGKLVWAEQCNHKFGRRGKLLLWEPGWVAVTAEEHELIHKHPIEARRLGLLCEVGQFNNQRLCK